MTEQILACPYCGSEEAFARNMTDDWHVVCKYCGSKGPDTDYVNDAILLWNAAANQLAAKDAEIEKLKQWLKNSMDEEKKRQDHAIERQSKLSNELQLERKRVAAGDARQDELEAEIEELRKEIKSWLELSQAQLNEKYLTLDQRDEARRVARRLYATNKELISVLTRSTLDGLDNFTRLEKLLATRNEPPTSRVETTDKETP